MKIKITIIKSLIDINIRKNGANLFTGFMYITGDMKIAASTLLLYSGFRVPITENVIVPTKIDKKNDDFNYFFTIMLTVRTLL